MSENNSPTVKERHEKGFSGVFFDWYLFELVEQRVLKWIELGVYAEIKSLCHKGKGCTATNSYIGSLLGISEDLTSRMVGKLKKLNLVEQTSFDGRRRTLHALVWGPEDTERILGSALGKCPDQTRGKSQGRPLQNPNQEYKRESKKEKGGDTSPDTPRRKILRPKKKKPDLEQFDRKAAAVLRTMMDEHNILRMKRAKIETLGRQVLRLRKEGVSKKQIKDGLLWWKKNYGDEFVPTIHKAVDIFEKFDMIEGQMKLRQKSTAKLNGRKITPDNMYDEDNCKNGVPVVWAGCDGKQYDGTLIVGIQKEWRKKYGKGYPVQEEVDGILEVIGEQAGSIPSDVIGRQW